MALQRSSRIHCSAIAEMTHDFNLPREAFRSYSLDDNLERALATGKALEEFDADLTLLEFHSSDRRNIQARSSFFQLDREPVAEMNDWMVIGAPGELAVKDPEELNTLSFEIRGIFLKTLAQEAEHSGLDFLRGLPYGDPGSPVQSYKGMSGGGLWSLSYFPERSADARYEVFLIGVNFWQSGREIRSLGRNAIRQLVQKVRRVTR